MDRQLIERFAAVTPEERRLLASGPLDMAFYSTTAALLEGKRLIPYEQMITVRPHTRFVAFPPHRHDFVEVMVMLSGQTVHTLGGRETVTLKAGEILLINRHATHAIALCGQGDVAVNFLVQPEFFDFALEMVGGDNALGKFLLDALRTGESSIPYLYFPVSERASIQHLLQSMLWGFVEAPGAYRRIHRVEMGLLFLHMMELADCLQLSTNLRHWNALAVELLSEIRTRYAAFHLKDFARAHGVSAAYVSRVAREVTGQSCTELLQQRRLEKARQLLQDTDRSILNICQAVGYNNSSYFYRLFELREGVSPKGYRSSHRL
ncbi:MAG: AraC family transcriptional regulator [Eubacteriales bacterium]|nr:AraC family transcriptional regulator [Eubacteriales bacterium]